MPVSEYWFVECCHESHDGQYMHTHPHTRCIKSMDIKNTVILTFYNVVWCVPDWRRRCVRGIRAGVWQWVRPISSCEWGERMFWKVQNSRFSIDLTSTWLKQHKTSGLRDVNTPWFKTNALCTHNVTVLVCDISQGLYWGPWRVDCRIFADMSQSPHTEVQQQNSRQGRQETKE